MHDVTEHDDPQWSTSDQPVKFKILNVDSRPKSGWPPLILLVSATLAWGQTFTELTTPFKGKGTFTCPAAALGQSSVELLILFGIMVVCELFIFGATRARGVGAWATFLTTCILCIVLISIHFAQIGTCANF